MIRVAAVALLVAAGLPAGADIAQADPLDMVCTGTQTITWNTGQTSDFSYDMTVTRVGGNTVVTMTGTITRGLFAGDSAVEVIVGPTLDTLKCLTPPGITSRTGVTTLTIT